MFRIPLRTVWLARFHYSLIVITVALSAGANVGVFAVFTSVWLRPSPVVEARRIAILSRRGPAGELENFMAHRIDRLRLPLSTVSIVGSDLSRAPLLRDSAPRLRWGVGGSPVRATAATSGFFEALGVQVQGRTFSSADDTATGTASIILSDSTWRTRFNRERVIGRELDLGPIRATVIGIAPRHFKGPKLGDNYEAWISFGAVAVAAGLPPETLRLISLTTYCRLKDGVSIANAESEIRRELATSGNEDLYLRTLADVPYPQNQQVQASDDQQVLMLLLVASSLLGVMGCLNIAGLEVAQHARRRKEYVVRIALGCSRSALVRVFAVETVLLALAAAAAATVVAQWTLGSLNGLVLPTGIGLAEVAPRIGLGGVGVSVGLSLASVIVGRFLPLARLLSLSRSRTIQLRADVAGSLRSGTVRALFLAAHVALCVVLTIGTLLFARTLQQASAFDLGFSKDGTWAVVVQPRVTQFTTVARAADGRQAKAAAARGFISGVKSLSEVSAVAFGELPLARGESTSASLSQSDRLKSVRFLVGPTYASAAGLRLVAGRDLEETDIGRLPRPVLVSESFAKSRWPPVRALGQVFGTADSASGEARAETARDRRQIVGIVQDSFRRGLRTRATPVMYELGAIDEFLLGHAFGFVVHGSARGDLASDIRRLAEEFFPEPVRLDVYNAEALIGNEMRTQRFGVVLFGWFAIGGLMLAAIGVYGLVSSAAELRKREMAIRSALGASSVSIARLIALAAALPVMCGMAVGFAASLGLGPFVSSLLFGVTRLDVPSFFGAIVVLLFVAAAGATLPAIRAATSRSVDVLWD